MIPNNNYYMTKWGSIKLLVDSTISRLESGLCFVQAFLTHWKGKIFLFETYLLSAELITELWNHLIDSICRLLICIQGLTIWLL